MRHSLGLATLCIFTACQSDPLPPSLPERPSSPPPPSLSLFPAPGAGVPAVVHLVVGPLPSDAEAASGLVLVQGEPSETSLRALRQGAPSKSLAEHVVPSTSWSLPERRAALAPSSPLARGAVYTLASREGSFRATFRVDDGGEGPIERVFPPDDVESDGGLVVFCGERSLAGATPLGEPSVVASTSVEPGLRGDARFETCITIHRMDGLLPLPAALVLPGGRTVALQPSPPRVGAPPTRAPDAPCLVGEQPIGRACLRVEDDRLRLKPPAEPLLVAMRASGRLTVRATSGGPVTLRGQRPLTMLPVEVTLLDARGGKSQATLSVKTREPRHRVIISEVLADAAGPEPSSEWVEIVNDGVVEADMTGWALEDERGSAPLPPTVLAPGQVALLVPPHATFDGDVQPRPGTLLVTLERLGDGGLSNSGERVALRDEQGGVVSAFPAGPRPRAGMSVQRRSRDSEDGDPEGFSLCADSGPTPGFVE